MEIKVFLSLITYALTIGAIENGTITVTSEDGITTYSTGEKIPTGTKIKITVTPSEGFEFTKYSVNGEDVTENPKILTVTEAINITDGNAVA